MAAPNEVAAIRRAVVLAAHGPVRGGNPRVGCVVLDTPGDLGIGSIDATARLRLTDVARLDTGISAVGVRLTLPPVPGTTLPSGKE